MTGLLASNGIWLEDEIQQSSDPAAHADGIVSTMKRERIGWAAVNAAIPGASAALKMLLDARDRHSHGACGYWTQNYPPHIANPREYLLTGELDGADIMIANPETREEEQRWSDQNIHDLCILWPNGHAGVCYTEAAWGKHVDGSYRKDLAQRWWARGIVSMPEAIQSENPNATISAMLGVSNAFGWAPERTSPTLYLTRGYPAINYDPEITQTSGRWSIFRYGDIGESDWETIANWPRPATTPPEPPEEPMPRGAAASAYQAMDYWMNSTARPADWRAANPGEWAAIQTYRASPPGTPAPTVNTKTGLMLVSILEAARWGAGEHE
jgi:hypothetical protein